jgi:tetratricopeptide (TPR) repeat protein
LHLAGTHLSASLTRLSTFSSYLQALDREPVGIRLLSPDPDTARAGDPRATVMRTWELSLDDLAAHGLPHARAVLRLLSRFAPTVPIPIDLLHPTDLVALLGPASEGRAPEEALRGLERLGLIDTAAGQRMVVVHPVIADANRAHLIAATGADPSLVWRTAVSMVARAVEALDWRQPGAWPGFRELTPHVRALLDVSRPERDREYLAVLLQVNRAVVNANHLAGAIPPAADLTRAALAHARELGEDHPTILASHQHRAYQDRERGLWQEAGRGFQQVLERRLRVLGPDHPDTLDSRYHLAWTRARLGHFELAELAELRTVLESRARVLGDDHPDVLGTRRELARAITAQGRWGEAGRLLQQLLETQRRVLGDDHPETLVTRHFLVREMARRARWERTVASLRALVEGRPGDPVQPAAWRSRLREAAAEFMFLLRAQQRVLGDDHLDTLATRLQLARLTAIEGRWAEAETMLGDVLAAQCTRLDDDHPNVLETREYLAWTVGGQGRWAEAETSLRAVLGARRRVHGPDHPYTLNTRHLVAWTVAGQQRLAEAEADLRDLLDDRWRVLARDHPDTLLTHIELAKVVARRGRREELAAAFRALADAERLIS